MNVDFINPFLSSLSNVLSTMGGVECKIGKPTLKNNKLSLGDVTGIIGMAEPQLKGSLAISFTQC